LQHVTKNFGNFTAVNDLTLEVAGGEFFGFLGPNGAGKTTSIKMMTGLFTPTSGTITIGGYDVVKDSLKAKSVIGYIPDQPYLYDKLTGREYLHFSAGLFNVPHASVVGKIREVTDALEIGSWIDRRAEDYSQGMRQRIAICAALLHDPQVLIVDEPMVGLDPRSALLVKNTFRRLAKEGATVFMSTHSLYIAEEVCDTVGIIKDAKLVFLDRVAALRNGHGDGRLEELFLELTR
jgi:ABC-2 type transport system ATP-binding protein